METNNKNLSIYEGFLRVVKKDPNRNALYYKGRVFSYKKLNELIIKKVDVLTKKLGIKKGDVVLIALPNIPDVIVLTYALNYIGAIANMVHPFVPYNQLKKIIKETNSKYAFVFEQRVAKEFESFKEIADMCYVSRIEDDLPFFKKLFYHVFMNFKIRKKLAKDKKSNFLGYKYQHSLKGHLINQEYNKDCGSEIALYLHSASTTDEPKTICITNYNMNFIAFQGLNIFGKSFEEVKDNAFVCFLPAFHGFGLCMAMFMPLCCGAYVALIPKFSPKEIVKVMEKVDVRLFCGVPSAYEKIASYNYFAISKKVRNIEVAYCGGDSLSESTKQKWDNIMISHESKCRLFEGYGLTESVAAILINRYNHHKDNTIGYPIDGAKVYCIDENGNEIKDESIGEIVIESPSNMVGYLNDIESTNKAIKNERLHTGDLGFKDKDGFLHFTSRVKRVIKVSGVGIFPNEIEKLISSLDEVKGCCAVGVKDDVMGNAIKLFVLTTNKSDEFKNKILDICRKNLIKWAVPKHIELVDELPYTQYNKVDYRKLQGK